MGAGAMVACSSDGVMMAPECYCFATILFIEGLLIVVAQLVNVPCCKLYPYLLLLW